MKPESTDGANRLPRLSAGAAVLVGAFLLLGAFGHVEAVWPRIQGEADAAVPALRLLLPAVLLGLGGVTNLALCKLLWDGDARGLLAALFTNSLLLAYLIYLLWRGVPGHPLVTFTSVVASFLVLVAAQRFGLVWPAGRRD